MNTKLLKKIKDNGLNIYDNTIPKYVVCNNCGLERLLNDWLDKHGKKCKLPKLDINKMT